MAEYLDISLSNYIIKAYRNKNGKINFHNRGHLIIKTNSPFKLTSYLEEFRFFLKLNTNNEILQFDSVDFSENTSIPYDGAYLVHDFHAQLKSNIDGISCNVAEVIIEYKLNFHNLTFSRTHNKISVIKSMI